ncbi:MAG: LysR family transcriptional regulator [Lachnospiraceae bacterium]|nr:LysR family transcriptional regulator [Lachnospiraceae bacterium]MDD3615712.1 LysR family transcriptional regulator [Lachnospiraceae bacterium]
MENRVLRYFLAVAREENITKASESLHVTQPTLSKQLMDLEDELGTKLFIRGKRKITLTEDGVYLRKRAQEIIELVDKTEGEFNERGNVISGDIYIGGGETQAMRLIAKAVKSLRDDYPDIRYHLYSGNADALMERMDKGLLDFGVLIEPANIKKYDYIKLPSVDTWGVLMRKDHPFAGKSGIRPEDMEQLDLIVSSQSMVENGFSGWMGKDFDQLNIIAHYNLIYNAALMVEEGVGCALTLDKLVNMYQESGDLTFVPLEPRMESGLNIVWKKYQVFSKAAEKFLEKLQESFL